MGKIHGTVVAQARCLTKRGNKGGREGFSEAGMSEQECAS